METPGPSTDPDNTATAPTLITLAATAMALLEPGSPPGTAEASSRGALQVLLPDRQRSLAGENLVLACMRVTDSLDGGTGASWVIPSLPGASPDVDLHRRLLEHLRDHHRTDPAGPAVTDAATAEHELSDVADALLDLGEIALLTVLNTVSAGIPASEPDAAPAPADGALLRRCLDLVAAAITGGTTPA